MHLHLTLIQSEQILILNFKNLECLEGFIFAMRCKRIPSVKLIKCVSKKEMCKIIKSNLNDSKICVIGAGNGGLAAAADLTIRGNEVILAELEEFEENIYEIRKNGGINLETLESTGLKGGFAKLYKVTTNMSEAISDAEIVLIITPSFAHKEIAKRCAQYLKKEHLIILAPGNLGGSIEFYNSIIEYGGDKDVIISEMECMMYACRKKNGNTIYVRGFKHNLGFSTFPSMEMNKEFDRVKKIYPNIVKRQNVIETGFSNINPILHVPILLYNLSNIDNRRDILMYHEALSKSIGKIAKSIDNERMSLNNISESIQLVPMSDIYKNWYYHQGARGSTFVELAGKNPIYYESKLPNTLNHRYLLEDIPYGLIPMISILDKFEIKTDNIKTVVNTASLITDVDFYKNARTLKSLGLNGKSKEQIINYIKYRK